MIDVSQWRKSIGLFGARKACSLGQQILAVIYADERSLNSHLSCLLSLVMLVASVISILLRLAGDIETNPGPKGKKSARRGKRTKSRRNKKSAQMKQRQHPSVDSQPESTQMKQRQHPSVDSQPAMPVGNVALRIVQKYQTSLLKCFESSPIELAHELCAKKLISDETRNSALHTKGMAPREQASILLIAVERVIDCDHQRWKPFKKFCSVIKKHSHMENVAEKLWREKQCLCDDDSGSDTTSSSESSCEEQITETPISETSEHASSIHLEKATLKHSKAKPHRRPHNLVIQPKAECQSPQCDEHPLLSPIPTPDPTPMQSYQKFLKATYRSKPFPIYHNKLTHFLGAKTFIHLVLVPRRKESKQNREKDVLLLVHGEVDLIATEKASLPMEEIGLITRGDKKMITHNILIEGAPGVGKTTFAWHLCHLWAKEELLQQWPIVVMLQLREEQIRQATTLADLFYHQEEKERLAVLKKITELQGEGVLLIFDGYDELSSDQLAVDSVFLQLLNGKLIPSATIIVTSRPLATSRLPRNFKDNVDLQHIEIVGFTKENINEYIKAACEGRDALLNAFMSYLSSHPFVSSCMYNPLHCTIVTELYLLHWSENGKEFAPKTLTEVYTHLVKSFLQRHLSAHPDDNIQPMVCCGPIFDIPKCLQKNLLHLGELAAQGILRRQYIFDRVPCQPMGFLRKVESIYEENEYQESYTFLHLTLQEFLAALYWCETLSLSKTEELITQPDLFPIQEFVKVNDLEQQQTQPSGAAHWPVLLFIAGIKKFRSLPLHEKFTTFGGSLQIVYPGLCRVLFECQCDMAIRKIFPGGNFVIFQDYFKSSLDWFAAGYSIAHSHSTSVWSIFANTQDQLEMLSKGLRYTSFKEGGKIDHLCVKNPSKAIFSLYPQTRKLTKLTLTGSPLDRNFFTQILFHFQFLCTLHIGDTNSMLSTHWHMINILPNFKHLQELKISFKDTDTDTHPFSDRLQQCQALKKLIINGNQYARVHSSLVSTLSPLLKDKLEHVELHHLLIHSEDAASISSSLQSHQCRLRTLKLRECKFQDLVVSQLANGLQNNTSLHTIAFDGSHFENNLEIVMLSQALKINTGLEKVKLQYQPSLPVDGLRELLESLNYNERIHLHLDQEYEEAVFEYSIPCQRVKFCQ